MCFDPLGANYCTDLAFAAAPPRHAMERELRLPAAIVVLALNAVCIGTNQVSQCASPYAWRIAAARVVGVLLAVVWLARASPLYRGALRGYGGNRPKRLLP